MANFLTRSQIKSKNFGEQTVEIAKTEFIFKLGVLVAYRRCLSRVTFYGPTNFAPTINYAASLFGPGGNLQDDGNTYLVLLIITDGQVLDPDATKRVKTFYNSKKLC